MGASESPNGGEQWLLPPAKHFSPNGLAWLLGWRAGYSVQGFSSPCASTYRPELLEQLFFRRAEASRFLFLHRVRSAYNHDSHGVSIDPQIGVECVVASKGRAEVVLELSSGIKTKPLYAATVETIELCQQPASVCFWAARKLIVPQVSSFPSQTAPFAPFCHSPQIHEVV